MAPNRNGVGGVMDEEDASMVKHPDGRYTTSSTEQCVAVHIEEEPSKGNIYKNLLLICFAFTCNFTAFGGVSNLQSSLNYEAGLGTGCLAIIYAALILSAMFTPTLFIKKMGCKWTICISIIGYLFYLIANFHPRWYTMVPASIMVGLSAAPLWAAKCTYLTTIATRYARLNNENPDGTVNLFFGIFFLFFQLNSIFGSLISSFVLSSADTKNLEFPDCYSEDYVESYCGAADNQSDFAKARISYNSSACPVSKLESGKVEDSTLYTLMGIYACVCLSGAAIVGLFVDNIELSKDENKDDKSPKELLVATFKHMKDRRQLLLIPITMYSGFEQAFFWGDYTRSFVTCPLAVNWVGFVLVCFGFFDASCSYIFGRIESFTGRIPLFTLAALINVSLCIVMLVWVPYPSSPVPFFAISAGWGVADAVWQTQLNAFYGVLFLHNKEAAFSNYRLWESLGFVIAFGYQNYVTVSYKLMLLLSLLPLGLILYLVVEHLERKKQPKGDGSEEKLNVSNGYTSGSSIEFKKDKIVTSI